MGPPRRTHCFDHVVVAAFHVQILETARAAVALAEPDWSCFFYTGSQCAAQRDETRAAWATSESFSILFLSQTAGGEGISLNEGSALIVLSLWFSETRRQQLIARLHRSGQARSVDVRYLCARGGLMEAIRHVQEKAQRRVRTLSQGEARPDPRLWDHCGLALKRARHD